jgi:hypothetical protein
VLALRAGLAAELRDVDAAELLDVAHVAHVAAAGLEVELRDGDAADPTPLRVASNTLIHVAMRQCAGIGRRTRLKVQRGTP